MIGPNDDENDDDDVGAMFGVLANDIHLSSKTFEWLNGIKKNTINDLQYVGKISFILLVNILNWNPCLEIHAT